MTLYKKEETNNFPTARFAVPTSKQRNTCFVDIINSFLKNHCVYAAHARWITLLAVNFHLMSNYEVQELASFCPGRNQKRLLFAPMYVSLNPSLGEVREFVKLFPKEFGGVLLFGRTFYSIGGDDLFTRIQDKLNILFDHAMLDYGPEEWKE